MAENAKVRVFKNFSLPKDTGCYTRLLFLSGKQKGDSFILLGDRILIGRNETCDVPLLEPLASREHAELKKIGDQYFVTDLGSQNGIVVNDLKISQQQLRDGDKIIIGKTVIKYGALEISENAVIEQLDQGSKEGQSALSQLSQIKKKAGKAPSSAVNSGSFDDDEEAAKKKKQNNKRVLIYGVLLLLLAVLFLDDGDPQKAKMTDKRPQRDLIDDKIQYLLEKKQMAEDKEVEKKLTATFQSGLREEREGNYYRAINEFNMALIISPGNARADFYLKRTKERLRKEVDGIMTRAVQEKEALRYRAAVSEYCTVIGMLQFDPEDENYKKAEENIKEIEKIMELDEGAFNCL